MLVSFRVTTRIHENKFGMEGTVMKRQVKSDYCWGQWSDKFLLVF